MRWIKEGDCNSRYFHSTVNWKWRYNMLTGVNVEGCWIHEPGRVKEETRLFFKRRFQEPERERLRLDGVRFKSIDQQHNALLVARFKEDEVRAAIRNCDSTKRPGPDGLNFNFIKQFCDLLKPNVLRFLNEFHANGVFPKGSYVSFLALIPKVNDPQGLNDYRPISLIGCINKIVAKVLSNRLKKVLPCIIDEHQSTFMEGRQLLHSVVVASKAVEEAKRRNKSCLVFKVDYEKAYDSVSWDFLY